MHRMLLTAPLVGSIGIGLLKLLLGLGIFFVVLVAVFAIADSLSLTDAFPPDQND